jgi:hypothetical protein
MISRIFKLVICDGVATANPSAQVRLLREDNRRTGYLTIDEQEELLLQCIGERRHLRSIVILPPNTGFECLSDCAARLRHQKTDADYPH